MTEISLWWGVLLLLGAVLAVLAVAGLASLRKMRAQAIDLRGELAQLYARQSSPVRAEARVQHDDPVVETPVFMAPWPVVIRALHFPDDHQDHEGIEALQIALNDPALSPVIRSAQDVLNLLGENHIYVDDLTIDHAEPAAWRAFAAGSTLDIGIVQDGEIVQKVRAKLGDDPVFHDCASHFMRGFEQYLAGFVPQLEDDAVAILCDTRTGRAFILLMAAS